MCISGMHLKTLVCPRFNKSGSCHLSSLLVPTPALPFKIITGVGKHSTNHVAILRPGVAKALEADGWRVDRGPSGRGYIVVRGVQGG